MDLQRRLGLYITINDHMGVVQLHKGFVHGHIGMVHRHIGIVYRQIHVGQPSEPL